MSIGKFQVNRPLITFYLSYYIKGDIMRNRWWFGRGKWWIILFAFSIVILLTSNKLFLSSNIKSNVSSPNVSTIDLAIFMQAKHNKKSST